MTNLMRSTFALAAGIALFAGAELSAQRNLVTFTGTVSDSARRPLNNAEIALPGVNLTRNTNDKGVFRFNEVPAGVHRVVIRHIGYGQLDTTLSFREEESVEIRVTLGRIVTLDSVIVSAPIDPLMAEFESNRARGFGRFMTRTDLARYDGATLPNVMMSMPGVAMTRGRVGAAWMTSRRQPTTGCVFPKPKDAGSGAAAERNAYDAQYGADNCLRRERVYYVPEDTERRQGMPRACFPQVFVDRTLMNSGVPTPPFDLTTYAPDQIEALEWYESPSQTPPKYSIHNAKCGVLVLHLRQKK